MAMDGGRTNVLTKSAQSPGKETESTKKSKWVFVKQMVMRLWVWISREREIVMI